MPHNFDYAELRRVVGKAAAHMARSNIRGVAKPDEIKKLTDQQLVDFALELTYGKGAPDFWESLPEDLSGHNTTALIYDLRTVLKPFRPADEPWK